MAWLRQRAGNNSQLVQANNVHYGISVKDAEYLCNRIFEEKFSYYSAAAFDTAKGRVQEFVLNYLAALNDKDPNVIENVADPGVQSALLEAESGFAKSGDENLGEILVSMLVERTKELERSPRQLAYNEALSVAQKLTSRHLNALSLLFFVRNVGFAALKPGWSDFATIFRAITEPISRDFVASASDIQYLIATSCCVWEGGGLSGGVSWGSAMHQRYPGLFNKGLEKTPEVAKFLDRDGYQLIVPKHRLPGSNEDSGLYQVNFAAEPPLREFALREGISEEEVSELVALMNSTPMNVDEIQQLLLKEFPYLGPVVEVWQSTGLEGCIPSVIGIAIAHSNFKRLVPAFNVDIGIWIK
jgi:hypothetical protein